MVNEREVGVVHADADNFSEWHRCKRWTDRGLSCPFGGIEREGGEPEDETSSKMESGATALQAAVGDRMAAPGLGGAMELIGPLLALFTVLRAVQTLGPGLKMGRVQAAGLGEEATVRVLRPHVPAREGPTPARPAPAKSPVGAPRFTSAPRGGGGGFFVNQAAQMRKLIGVPIR